METWGRRKGNYWNYVSSFSVTSFSSLTRKKIYSQNHLFPFFYPTFLSDLGLSYVNQRKYNECISHKFPYHPPLAKEDCRKQIVPQEANLVQLNNATYALDLYSFSFCTDSSSGSVTNANWYSNWCRGNSWRCIHMRFSTAVLLGAALKIELLPSIRRAGRQLSLLTCNYLYPLLLTPSKWKCPWFTLSSDYLKH